MVVCPPALSMVKLPLTVSIVPAAVLPILIEPIVAARPVYVP